MYLLSLIISKLLFSNSMSHWNISCIWKIITHWL